MNHAASWCALNLTKQKQLMSDLTELFGIQSPIIQAPMAGVQGSAMAVAVSEAGGLGSLPCAMLTPQALRAELQAISTQTKRPYNLNFFCHTPPLPEPAREAAWRQALAPFYAEFGIDASSIAAGAGRAPFSAPLCELIEPFKPPVLSFHFGLPGPQLLDKARAWGAKIISSATTVREALWLQERGVDAVIAQGLEAGGHRGMFLTDDLSTQIGTMALLPQLVHALRVPVIAAGGIADAAGVRAAKALGAAGVQIGSAYMCCPEATTSALHRAALQSSAAQHTALTNLFTGRPARGMMNRLMRELGPISPAAPAFPLATAALAPLRAAAEKQGSGDFSPLWAGQNATACRDVGAAQLTRELAAAWG
jgi:nitronate monooxygenase